MHPSLQQDIPEFLFDSIVYCDSLRFNRNEKSSFVLTKNLKFYEFRRKQLLHSIDLSETCFAKLQQKIMIYNGPKSKWLTDLEINEPSSSSHMKSEAALQTFSKFDIKFGKYIYKIFDISKLYLLLICWDKLIILQRSSDKSTPEFGFVAEIENVANFKIVACTDMKYQAAVKITFLDETSICVDFEKEGPSDSLSNPVDLQPQKGEFKQLLERVQRTKTELEYHKEITNKIFQSLRNEQTFGNNFVRSTSLHEKPMLTRCGDVWVRITYGEELVIGVPLINNCAPPNLTILKNLKPVLGIYEPKSVSGTALSVAKSIYYQYRMYQLQQAFDDLETVETFFQTEDVQFQQNKWVITDSRILPSSFVVLLIKFRLSQLTFIDEECPLFIRFQIEKEIQMDEPETHIFEQHLFIKTLDFQEILQRRQEHEISFHEKTLHQDFLAISMASFETQLQLNFLTCADQNNFENYLALKFDFEIVHRKSVEKDDNTRMDIDENPNECKTLPCTIFYNKNPRSIWFGALVMRAEENETSRDGDTFQSSLTFYNKNQDNAILMFKLLFQELIALKCNVIDIKNGPQCQNLTCRTANFENALRQEIIETLSIAKNEYNEDTLLKKFKSLIKYQYNSDILSRTMPN